MERAATDGWDWAASSTSAAMPGGDTARESTSNLPAGLLVHGDRSDLGLVFGALIPLQPVAWTGAGLLCAPRTAPVAAAAALTVCPAPASIVAPVRIWPDVPCRLVAGWYRRSVCHAEAPDQMRELVQTAGGGFGPGDHPTTLMCLTVLDALPPADAIDVGCGSGLLTQAWARLDRGRVLAIDLDPSAVLQTRESADLAGVGAMVHTRRQAIQTLRPSDLKGVTVLANIPAAAHHALLGRLDAAPTRVVLSGLRPAESGAVLERYRALGMHRDRSMRVDGFDCHVLAGS